MGFHVSIEGDDVEPQKHNKYAFLCCIVASMISIIFGYGMFSIFFFNKINIRY